MAVPRALRTVSNLLFNPNAAIPDVEKGAVAAARKARPALADLGTRTGAAVASFQNPTASMVPPNASAGTTASYTGAPPIASAAPAKAAAAPVRTNYPITDPVVVRAQQQPAAPTAAPTAAPAAAPAAASPLQARTPTASAAPDGGTTAKTAVSGAENLVGGITGFRDTDNIIRTFNGPGTEQDTGLVKADERGVPLGTQMVPVRGLTQGTAQVGVPVDVQGPGMTRTLPSLTKDGRKIDATPYYGPGRSGTEGVAAAQERQADFDARTAATAERFNLGVVRPSLVNSASPGASRNAKAGLLAQDMAGRGYDTLGRRSAADATANQASLIGAKGAAELAVEAERTNQEREKGRSLVDAARVTGDAGVRRQTVESTGAVDVAKVAQSTAALQADQTRAAQVAERERAAVEKLSLRNETARRQSYDDLAAWTNRNKDEDDRTYAKRLPTVYAQLALMEASMIRSGLSVANPQGIRGLLKTVVLENAPAEVQQKLAARMMRGETINQIVAADSQIAQYIDMPKLQALPQF